ncbi:CHAT domain-containing tetratricopeptide repeat protein [Nostoc sp.]|uniref:CHAT domain-containing tetratricopeptide repeat protein n=1 Tax=Nostoc sp. TaxID=1180 RepID=UPI002FF7E950
MNKNKKNKTSNKSESIYQELVFLKYETAKRKLNKGIALYNSNPKAALDALRKAIKLCEKLDKSNINTSCLFGMGYAYALLGKHKEAIEQLNHILIIADKLNNNDMQAGVFNILSQCYSYIGEFHRAIDCENKFIIIAKKYRQVELKAISLNNLGKYHNCIGYYRIAINHLTKSLSLAQKIGNQECVASALSNLGDSYYHLGELQKSREYHQQSLAIEEKIGNHIGAALSSGGLANTHHELGQNHQAIDQFHKLLNVAHKMQHSQGKVNSLLGLGNVYFDLRDYEKAVNYYQNCLEIARKVEDAQGEADSLIGFANVYFARKEYKQAIYYNKQSLIILQKICDRKGLCIALGNLGSAHSSLGESKLRINYYQKSLTIAREIGDCIKQGKCLHNLGLILLSNNQLTEAEANLSEAIQIWENIRLELANDADKISIFETQSVTYTLLQKVLVSQNKILEALEISERGRTRALLELLAKRLATKPLGSIQELRLDEAIKPPNIDTIKHIAEVQKSTIVEYSIIDAENLYIWVIKPTGEIIFRQVYLEDETSLEEILLETHERIANSSWPDVAQPFAQQIYQYLIQPISDLLPTDPNESVIFVPQHRLFLIPFSALQNKATGKFLIEQHSIVTVASIMMLNLTHQQKERVKNLNLGVRKDFIDALVVGNPTMPIDPSQPPKPLKPLPHAEEEAKEIASLLNTEALIGNNALKLNILQQMPKARLIHLATHGILDITESSIPGAIALAPSDNDSGFLTSNEILDLDLNAELVVLSACDTGRGIITSDGVIGLSRCLFLAGVPSIILSLLKVQDSSTKLLMIEFYQHLHSGMNKAQALRQAMLALMQQYRNCPNRWAAFTLIGEAE